MNLRLNGKRALVCGASQGIGEATAHVLASLGAQVLLLARSEEKLKAIAAQLPGEGHHIVALDIADRVLLSKTLERLCIDPVEILICNTGGPKAGALLDATDEDFTQGFANHVLVNSLLVKKLLPGMNDRKYGRVINIISTSVKVPIPQLGVSNTIRAAVANWAKTLSLELAPRGITVNNVLPGYTETPRLMALMSAAAKRLGQTESEIEKTWKNSTPMGRFASANEIANAVGFLASPAASFITGINLPVDGGRTGCL